MSNNVTPEDAQRAALISAMHDYLALRTKLLAPDLAEMVTREGMLIQGCSVAAATVVLKDPATGQASIEQFTVFSIVGTSWQNYMPIFGRMMFDRHNWLQVMRIAKQWMNENPGWEREVDPLDIIETYVQNEKDDGAGGVVVTQESGTVIDYADEIGLRERRGPGWDGSDGPHAG